MIKSILILALTVLAQGQVTVRIPVCDPGLGSGTTTGLPAGATGLVPGAPGGEGASGGAGAGGAPDAGGVPGAGSVLGGSVGGGSVGGGSAPGGGSVPGSGSS